MQEMVIPSSLVTIEFPRQTTLIKRLRYISFAIDDVVLLLSALALFIFTTNIFGLKVSFLDTLAISPCIPVLFILSGTTLLFGAKRHLISIHHATEEEAEPKWLTLIPIALAGVTTAIGFINVVQITNTGVVSLFHTSIYGGFCFFLIGLALIPPFTHILHRFHISQFLIYLVSGLNVFVVLENLYQLLSPSPMQHIFQVPLVVALIFTVFCFGILLRWSNRGFFGNFTLKSTVSMFALRLFLINLISGPVITFLVLLTTQNASYNLYQVITIIVSLFTVLVSALLWVNVKLLYKYDLEHLLMRESLRSHNIDLTTEEEELRRRIAHIEQEKQQYLDKLTSENILKDVVDQAE